MATCGCTQQHRPASAGLPGSAAELLANPRGLHGWAASDSCGALQQVVYSPSVDVRPEWTMVEQIAFPSFAKLHFAVPAPEDVAFCGQLQYYDKVRRRCMCTAGPPQPCGGSDGFTCWLGIMH